MTTEDRLNAIIDFGFTERQARFLVLVMRHAGVCVPRQYATFAGIANGGEKCNAFFEKLVTRGYAVACGCVHNRARLFRIHHKPLYRAIGEPESRYRRPVPARLAVPRVMWLDAALVSPDLIWLTTEAERVAYVSSLIPPTPGAHPPVVSSRTVGAVGAPLPIGIESSGRVVLLYLAKVPWTDEFRAFIQAHAALLRIVPLWTIRVVFPRPIDRAYAGYQQVVREELETPLHPATVTELKSHFNHRRTAGTSVDSQLQALLDRAAEIVSSPRFTRLYQRWLKHGDAVFDAIASPVLTEALSTGAGRVECVVLPHTYRQLSPLASLVRSTPQGVEKGEQGGERRPSRPQPPHSTPWPPAPVHRSLEQIHVARSWNA